MKKIAIFAFKGDPMCFIHVLLNAINFHEAGYDTRIIMEGEATKLVRELDDSNHPLHSLYKATKEKGLIDAVCLACATKMGVADAVKAQKLPFGSDMSGHPSMSKYIENGFEIITL